MSGNCTYRYDVAGDYHFTSGVVAKKDNFKLAFGGTVKVKPKEDETVNVSVSVKGDLSKFFSRYFCISEMSVNIAMNSIHY